MFQENIKIVLNIRKSSVPDIDCLKQQTNGFSKLYPIISPVVPQGSFPHQMGPIVPFLSMFVDQHPAESDSTTLLGGKGPTSFPRETEL